jgi:hypothetical protein
MKSLGAKIKQITGLPDGDLASEKEIAFVSSLPGKTNDGADTTHLTAPQIEWIEDIYERNFGDG